MNKVKRNIIPVPLWLVCLLLTVLGIGWLCTFHFLETTNNEKAIQILSSIGNELVKAVVVTCSIGIAVDRYLRSRLKRNSFSQILTNTNIDKIYKNRVEAANDFQKLVRNKKVNDIYIIGISLHDFMNWGGKLSDVWQEICCRLKSECQDDEKIEFVKNVELKQMEHISNLKIGQVKFEPNDFFTILKKMNLRWNNKDRLRVKILLLNPKSSEGYFRRRLEAENVGLDRLLKDVSSAIDQIVLQQNEMENKEYLQFGLYEHCPFGFMFVTNTEMFIEQYCYQPRKFDSASFPLIKYKSDSPQYKMMFESINAIWDNALKEKISSNFVGPEEALKNAGVHDIYRKDKRDDLSLREKECLDCIKKGDTIDIISIAGNFFISPSFIDVIRKKMKEYDENSFKIRFIVINPVSQQAIMRAAAENSVNEDLNEVIKHWNWDKHCHSKLYRDVKQSMEDIGRFIKTGKYPFELRVSSGTISCSLFMTPKSAFVEQYFYGRSQENQENYLRGEYLVIEYDMEKNGVEQQILKSSFNVTWDSYSFSLDEYKKIDEQSLFIKNLEIVGEELGLTIRAQNLAC